MWESVVISPVDWGVAPVGNDFSALHKRGMMPSLDREQNRCFSLEWKTEGAMDDDSKDNEEDEGEEDWLRQGWRSETGSLFQRRGDEVRC